MPKVLAVSGVLFATLLISALAAILVQLARGVTALQPLQYLYWYLLPMTVDMVLLAILSVFVSSRSPSPARRWRRATPSTAITAGTISPRRSRRVRPAR